VIEKGRLKLFRRPFLRLSGLFDKKGKAEINTDGNDVLEKM